MARDKLITIRIEGEKREAFNNLAKSQNTDTASLLYDFINQCLSGRIDISLVTGKKQWIDNQLDTNRLDKLETATQKIDERVGIIAKKLDDWIEAFGDRLTDCDRELSEKTISLEHRLNALAIQLDSQQIDSMDSKLNESIARLGSCFSHRLLGLEKRLDEMELLLRMQREASIATSPLPPSPSLPPDEPDRPAIETVTPEVSPSPPSPPDAIASIDGTVETVSTDSSIETVAIEDSEKKITLLDTSIASPIGIDKSGSEPGTDAIGTVGMTAKDAAKYLKTKKVVVSYDSLHRWISREKIPDTSPQGKNARKHLILRDGRYFPTTD